MNKKRNQKGFTLVEMMVVIIIIMAILGVAAKGVPKAMTLWRNAVITNQAKDMQQGAIDYSNGVGHYTGVDCAQMVTDEIIDASYGDCSDANPYGGSIAVSVGTSAYELNVVFGDIPKASGNSVARKSNGSAVYDESAKTLTWAFKS